MVNELILRDPHMKHSFGNDTGFSLGNLKQNGIAPPLFQVLRPTDLLGIAFPVYFTFKVCPIGVLLPVQVPTQPMKLKKYFYGIFDSLLIAIPT